MEILRIISISLAVVVGAVLWFTIKRKMNYPEKSYLYCFLNAILGPLRFLKLGPYSVGPDDLDSFMKRASKMTKLTDFGGTEFIHSYKLLLDTAFQKSMVYSNLGYIAAQLDVIFVLVARLRKTKYIKENPEILNVPVREPVFVMGLPRTGTTFLHRLLSLDPKVRAPLLWELANSVPVARPNASFEERQICREKRCKLVKSLLKRRDFIGDDALTHIHEIGADLPEECLVAMREDIPLNLQYLMSLYMNFDYLYERMKVTSAYVWYKKVLQMLSFQYSDEEARSPRRWMLKCPAHLLYTKEIASVFPDAKIIWYDYFKNIFI